MDKTEQFLRNELDRSTGVSPLDLDEILNGTHARIRRRSRLKKTALSAPIVALLFLMVYIVIPKDGADQLLPGSELLMAGWENSWTESELLETTADTDDLYDQSVDYLINNNYYGYADEAADLLDESDLEALYGYMKEA